MLSTAEKIESIEESIKRYDQQIKDLTAQIESLKFSRLMQTITLEQLKSGQSKIEISKTDLLQRMQDENIYKRQDPCDGCTNPYDACPEPDDHGHCRYERGYRDPYESELREMRERAEEW